MSLGVKKCILNQKSFLGYQQDQQIIESSLTSKTNSTKISFGKFKNNDELLNYNPHDVNEIVDFDGIANFLLESRVSTSFEDTLSDSNTVEKCKKKISSCLRKFRQEILTMDKESHKLFPNTATRRNSNFTVTGFEISIAALEPVQMLKQHFEDEDVYEMVMIHRPEFSHHFNLNGFSKLDIALKSCIVHSERSFHVDLMFPTIPELELRIEQYV